MRAKRRAQRGTIQIASKSTLLREPHPRRPVTAHRRKTLEWMMLRPQARHRERLISGLSGSTVRRPGRWRPARHDSIDGSASAETWVTRLISVACAARQDARRQEIQVGAVCCCRMSRCCSFVVAAFRRLPAGVARIRILAGPTRQGPFLKADGSVEGAGQAEGYPAKDNQPDQKGGQLQPDLERIAPGSRWRRGIVGHSGDPLGGGQGHDRSFWLSRP